MLKPREWLILLPLSQFLWPFALEFNGLIHKALLPGEFDCISEILHFGENNGKILQKWRRK